MRQVTQNSASHALCALLGPTSLNDGISRCTEFLEQTRGDRRSMALVMAYSAELHAMNGEFEASRGLIAESRSMLQDLGGRLHAAVTSMYAGRIELLAGDPVAAERALRPEVEALQKMGGVYYLSTVAALLSEALYLQGRFSEAEDLSRVSEQAADEGDPDTQHHWRSARAKIAARLGRGEEAQGLAVEYAGRTDSPVFIGRTLLDRSEVLHLAGRHNEARVVAGEALAVAEAKGDVASAARAVAAAQGAPDVALADLPMPA